MNVLVYTLNSLALIISLGLSLFSLSLFFLRYKQTKMRILLLVTLLYIFSSLLALLQTILFISQPETMLENSKSLSNMVLLLQILQIMFFNFFFFFIDYFENENLSAKKVITVSILTTLLIYGILNLILMPQSLRIDFTQAIGEPIYPLLTFNSLCFFLNLPLSTYVLVSSWRAINNVKQFTDYLSEQQKNQLSLLQFALAFFYGTSLLGFLNGFFNAMGTPSDEVVLVLGIILPTVTSIIGQILMIRSYALSKNVVFLQPQRLNQLIVLNNAGLPLFQHDFGRSGSNITLLSGAITALNSLFQEAVGVTSDLRSIGFGNREIIFLRDANYTILLITQRPSQFLQNALKEFKQKFNQEYGDENLDVVELEKFEAARDMVKEAFSLT